MFLRKVKLPLLDFGPGKDAVEQNAKKLSREKKRKENEKSTGKLALIDGRVTRAAVATALANAREGMPKTMMLQAPRTKRYRLDDFHVLTIIGQGVFSEVKLVRHIFEEQVYALKVYKKSEIATTSKILRLRDEIELLRVCKHPFILPLISTFQDPCRMYLMFEYMQGVCFRCATLELYFPLFTVCGHALDCFF